MKRTLSPVLALVSIMNSPAAPQTQTPGAAAFALKRVICAPHVFAEAAGFDLFPAKPFPAPEGTFLRRFDKGKR
jgi:hypothetical protein